MLDKIDRLIKRVRTNMEKASKSFLIESEEDFLIRFAHESTKIEGNTLSIYEVKTLLVDKISVSGKSLREVFEIINHEKAMKIVKEALQRKKDLSEDLIKDLHQSLLENIFLGGVYRIQNVRISGASFSPPSWMKVREEMDNFIYMYQENTKTMHPVNLAAWVHAEFVRIHPFSDGNGRTARILMNFILLKYGYLPIVIQYKDRASYYEVLDEYGKKKDPEKFFSFIQNLELQEIERELAGE